MGPHGSVLGYGTRWYTGTEAPPSNTIGNVNDLYFNTSTSDVYVKTDSGWQWLTNIRGPQGAQGIPGTGGITIRYVSALGGTYTGLNCGDLLVLDIPVQIVLPSGAYSPGHYFDILSVCGDFSGAAGITRDNGSIIDDTISPTGPLFSGYPTYYPNRRFCQCRVHYLGNVDYSSLPVWLLTNNTHYSTSPGGF